MGFMSGFVEGFFFNTDNRTYWLPQHFGLKAKRFKTTAAAGHQLSGLVLESKKKDSIGTIFFFTPALYNVSFNIGQAAFLTDHGFNVLMFDYSGCGNSLGHSSIAGLLSDAQAVFGWFKQSEYYSGKVALFAQALGCDAALQFYSKNQADVCGLALESCYASRQGWIKDKWGPVIGDLAASQLNIDAIEPKDVLPTIRVPLIEIFPEKDTYIHSNQKSAVFNVTPKSAEIWNVSGAKSLAVFPQSVSNQERLAHFFEKKCFKRQSK